MSGGGGKSGSESVETSLPEWLRAPAERNLQRAEDVQRLGYMPYRGPEVVGFTNNQIAAMQNNNDAARAFGFAAPIDAMAGMPTTQMYAGGIRGYDSNAIYDQALADTKAYQPETVDQYNALFGKNVATTANPNPLPTGRPSGGSGGKDLTYQETIDEMYPNGYKPNTPTAMQNYLDDSQLNYQTINSAYDNYNSPGHPSRANYNYDDPDDVPTDRTARAMDDTADIEAGMQPQLSSRLNSKGYTPTNVSQPIDEIMADFLAGK
jgi:hypothetical protein